jgi:hypothetical protein
VAGTDHAAELRVVVDERVPLVEQQRRMKPIDRAVERRGGDVAGGWFSSVKSLLAITAGPAT